MSLPGKEISKRPLHFIWICDCSSSMNGDGKIQSLNNAIRQAIPLMQDAAEENPNANVLVRAVKFSTGAQWHISQPTPVDQFYWEDLIAEGVTSMGQAMSLVAEQLKTPPMENRGLPPVLVLLSDGYPTDDFNSGLKKLMEQSWAKKAVRVAIAIGKDADLELLQKFIAHPELQPLEANNPDQLVALIKWASTAVLKAVSNPQSQPDQPNNFTKNYINIPKIPETIINSGGVSDIW